MNESNIAFNMLLARPAQHAGEQTLFTNATKVHTPDDECTIRQPCKAL